MGAKYCYFPESERVIHERGLENDLTKQSSYTSEYKWIFELVLKVNYRCFGNCKIITEYASNDCEHITHLFDSLISEVVRTKDDIEIYGKEVALKNLTILMDRVEKKLLAETQYWLDENQIRKSEFESFCMVSGKYKFRDWHYSFLHKDIVSLFGEDSVQINKDFETYFWSVKGRSLFFTELPFAFYKRLHGLLLAPTSAQSTVEAKDQVKKKHGRSKDSEIQNRNIDIFTTYLKFINTENKSEREAIQGTYLAFRKKFNGEPKGIKDQIRRIINNLKATQSDTN